MQRVFLPPTKVSAPPEQLGVLAGNVAGSRPSGPLVELARLLARQTAREWMQASAVGARPGLSRPDQGLGPAPADSVAPFSEPAAKL